MQMWIVSGEQQIVLILSQNLRNRNDHYLCQVCMQVLKQLCVQSDGIRQRRINCPLIPKQRKKLKFGCSSQATAAPNDVGLVRGIHLGA